VHKTQHILVRPAAPVAAAVLLLPLPALRVAACLLAAVALLLLWRNKATSVHPP
jgi:hypothetical protein